MNQRIRELKHLASVWCDENIPEQYSEETNGYGKAWEDKFAELIVRECSSICRGVGDAVWAEQHQSNIGTARTCDAAILLYFGVEE
jgi:biotin-(acetyl-CoA carboxylase) ligase